MKMKATILMKQQHLIMVMSLTQSLTSNLS
jgi:hypothetical protein